MDSLSDSTSRIMKRMIKIRVPDRTKTDNMKLLLVVKVGALSGGLLVVGIERLFSIPQNSTLSDVLVPVAIGVFSLLFVVLLLKQPRWILTREAQQDLREQAKQRVAVPLAQSNPFEPLSNQGNA